MTSAQMGAYEEGARSDHRARRRLLRVGQHGKRYLGRLSVALCTNSRHGRADVAQAGADQARSGLFTNWSYVHHGHRGLRPRWPRLAPGGSEPRLSSPGGGAEAVESALNSAARPQAARQQDEVKRHRPETPYHGTTHGL